MKPLARLSLSLLCISVLCGCSLDNVRPDINRLDAMRTSPPTIKYEGDEESSDADSDTSTDNPTGGTGSTGGGSVSFVNGSAYNSSMRTSVDAIKELIASLPSDKQLSIYFTCISQGSTIDPDTGEIVNATTYNGGFSNGIYDTFYGNSLSQAIYDTLIGYDNNRVGLKALALQMKSEVEKALDDSTQPHSELVEYVTKANPTKSLEDMLKIYDNFLSENFDPVSANVSTIRSFLPSYTMSMPISAAGSGNILITTRPDVGIDQPYITRDTIDKFFNIYNNGSINIETRQKDDKQITGVYIDKYNKAMFYLGVTGDTTLKDVFGDKYSELLTCIDDIKFPNVTSGKNESDIIVPKE